MEKLITKTSQITTTIISNATGKNTYAIERTLSNIKGDTAIIVLLYPTVSSTRPFSEDSTLLHLTRHMAEMKLNRIVIINLFSYVCRSRLSTRGIKVDDNNLRIIEKIITEKKKEHNAKLILAWGTSMSNCKAARETKKRIIEFYNSSYPDEIIYNFITSDEKINKVATHPLYLGIRGNNSNRDEFVFMTVTVPKAQVTLLDESGTNKGNPKTNLAENTPQQLFRLVAEPTDPNTALQVPSVSGRDIDFSYHSGSNTADGWVLLTSDTTGSDYDLYVFGYNKKMLPADETVTLFDKVQLKSFIDGEKKDGVTIGVKGYGIQADYLRGTNVDFTKAHYSAADLNEIYSIVRNKAGI